MGDMKEIRDAALAYYHNLSEEQKLGVYAIFRKWDTDGDGSITFKEFEQIFVGSDGDHINQLFQDLDKNGDGRLDLEESVTLIYCHVNQRVIGCDGCKAPFLKGLYFTCVDCFHHKQTKAFDLCTSCYTTRNYVHHHSNFLDNYALLRSYNNSESTKQPSSPFSRLRSRNKGKAVRTSVDVVNAGVDIVSTVAPLCSIM